MSNIAYFPKPHVDQRPGKRERTKTANRQAILDAAREVFGELGYDAATVRDIIRRTGLASGTFYNYYKSKEEVFDEVREAFARVLEQTHAPPVDLDYLTAACIAVAREIGDKMLERRPVDTEGAADFAVKLILGGLPALPRL